MSYHYFKNQPHTTILNSISNDLSYYQNVPIVIDLGLFEIRSGYSIDHKPNRFRNCIGISKNKRDGNFKIIGDNILEIEYNRIKLKYIYDKNCIVYYDYMEDIYDYIFYKLGINDEKVNYPIVLTETVNNPNYCRQQMNELLFECYGIPSISYGIDALYSYHHNFLNNNTSKKPNNGLIINSGWESTHIIPILDGRASFDNTYRLDIGGSQMYNYLFQLTNLKYPKLYTNLNVVRGFEILENYCYYSTSFIEELNNFKNGKLKPIIFQLPFDPNQYSTPITDDMKQMKEDRRAASAQRLKEISYRKRQELLAEKEAILEPLENIKLDLIEGVITYETFIDKLLQGGFENEDDYEMTCANLKKSITSISNKLQGIVEEEELVCNLSYEERFPLVNVADELLSPENKKAKKFQQMQMARAIKIAERNVQKQEEEQKKLELFELYKEMPTQVITKLESQKQVIVERQAHRRKLRNELQNRRSGQSKKRMQIVASLGSNNNMDESKFGDSEQDWAVYRDLSKKEGADSDSENDAKELLKLDNLLEELEPDRVTIKQLSSAPRLPTAEDFQLDFTSEAFRVPELLFQPSLTGVDCMGLGDLISRIITHKIPSTHLPGVLSNIFLTGGSSRLPGFSERLFNEITANSPANSTIKIYKAMDPCLDAWNGAADVANSPQFDKTLLTRAMYEEFGYGYLKENFCSNFYRDIPEPAVEGTEVSKSNKKSKARR